MQELNYIQAHTSSARSLGAVFHPPLFESNSIKCVRWRFSTSKADLRSCLNFMCQLSTLDPHQLRGWPHNVCQLRSVAVLSDGSSFWRIACIKIVHCMHVATLPSWCCAGNSHSDVRYRNVNSDDDRGDGDDGGYYADAVADAADTPWYSWIYNDLVASAAQISNVIKVKNWRVFVCASGTTNARRTVHSNDEAGVYALSVSMHTTSCARAHAHTQKEAHAHAHARARFALLARVRVARRLEMFGMLVQARMQTETPNVLAQSAELYGKAVQTRARAQTHTKHTEIRIHTHKHANTHALVATRPREAQTAAKKVHAVT
eukprot:6213866-Pleurochrysis_carterae.AAC.3